MLMIAAYRAERLSQRPVLRTSLHQSHVARRAARSGEQARAEPSHVAPADAPTPVSAAVEPKTLTPASVFASLVSTAVAEQQDEAARSQGAQVEAAPTADIPAAETAEVQPAEVNLRTAEPAPPADPTEERPAITVEQMADVDWAIQAEMPNQPAVPPLDEPILPKRPLAYDPPLAEIGFGPGMLIRLSQLGLYTTADLAQADAVQLRSALGDISRLVDVDAWIKSAQQAT
jgi:hypothetical protein